MNRKLSPYELQLSKEILKLSKLNGSLIGSLEGILHLNIDSDIKIDIAETVREAKIASMQKELSTSNLCHKIVEICFNHFDIPVEKALSDSRKPNVIKPKYFSMYFMREELSLSDSDIGRYFNHNHASIIYAIKTMSGYIELDKAYKIEYKALKEKIKLIYI
jgi:chromosomal replication initiation ATPase DnaA